ncbi:MAG: efflux RND transporter periplasmic adaptor subunit [Verrucomicrobia bacterium]|nr:efflux RND transporter periplasmic adaptor subunit [Verrucomicrobiota bacterium]
MNPSRLSTLLVAILLAATVYILGIRPRLKAETTLDANARAAGRPIVNLAVAQRRTSPVELVLPASLGAFQDTPIYARTNGYIARWSADLGDRVKTGQILAVIDGPELEQELAQAKANLAQAQANLELARISATRWKNLGAQNAVAQQEVDEKAAAFTARQADVLAAQANAQRLSQLKDYQTITAPFDGVISTRNVEIGQLVTAGAGKELFHLAQTDVLRVYVDVPQSYVRAIQIGLPAEITVAEFPGHVFTGKIVRFAGALDSISRTLRTEIQLPNPQGELYVGMFGQVRLHLAGGNALLVPSNAIIIRPSGALVAALGANNQIHLQPVQLGRDYGTQIEVLSGLPEGARLVANPSDSLSEDLAVEPAAPAGKS